MNAMREFMPDKKSNEKQPKMTLVNNEMNADKKEADKMTKEYLNEKLYYFYNNGGPIMDI